MHRRNIGTESWRGRGVAELRRLEEGALLDKRRRDLEIATDPSVQRIMKAPDAPCEAERTAHENQSLTTSTVVGDFLVGSHRRRWRSR